MDAVSENGGWKEGSVCDGGRFAIICSSSLVADVSFVWHGWQLWGREGRGRTDRQTTDRGPHPATLLDVAFQDEKTETNKQYSSL